MKRNRCGFVTDVMEYVLLLCIIIESNSLYRQYKGLEAAAEQFMDAVALVGIAVLALLQLLHRRPFSRQRERETVALGILYVCCGVFYWLNIAPMEDAFAMNHYFRMFLVFLPLMVLLFQRAIWEGRSYDLWRKHAHLVEIYAVINIILYVILLWNAGKLGFETISSGWSGGTEKNYFGLLVVQPASFLRIKVYRNFGIFPEPLMYSVPLITALFTELFLSSKKVRWNRVLLLSVTMLTTFSTLGILIGLLGAGIYVYGKLGKHSKKAVGITLSGLAIIGVILLISKYRTSGTYIGGSFRVHVTDFWYAFLAFLKHPLIGNGYGNDSAISACMPPERLEAAGTMSNTIAVVGAHGGLLLFTICTLPYFVLMLQAVKQRNRKLAAWGVGVFALYVGIAFYYHYYMMMVMAFGYAWLTARQKTPTQNAHDQEPQSDSLWFRGILALCHVLGIGGLMRSGSYIAALLLAMLGCVLLGMYIRQCTRMVRRRYREFAKLLIYVLLVVDIFCLFATGAMLGVYQMMYRSGLLMSQRLLALPLLAAIYLVVVKWFEYCKHGYWKRGAICRMLMYALISMLLAAAWMRQGGAWLFTYSQMNGWWGESVVMVAPVVLFLLIYAFLYAVDVCCLRRRMKPRQRYAALAAVILIASVCFGTFLYAHSFVEDHRTEYDEIVSVNDELIEDLVRVSNGRIISLNIPTLYAERYAGMSTDVWSEYQLIGKDRMTVLTPIDYESDYLVRCGYMVSQVSEEHFVYTNDETVIAWLKAQGYRVNYNPIRVKDINMWMVGYRNSLEYNGTGGVYVNGPWQSIIYGPYDHLRQGEYHVEFELTISGDLSQPEAVPCKIVVSADGGKTMLKESEVHIGEVKEDGSVTVALDFATEDVNGVEFLLTGYDGWLISVHSIKYMNCPGYDAREIHDASNRLVRVEYYDLDGKKTEGIDGFFAKEMVYGRNERIKSEWYYSVNEDLLSEGVAQREWFYDESGYNYDIVSYDNTGQIISHTYEIDFLRDLMKYQEYPEYQIYLAVKDEASSGITKRAEKALKKMKLVELTELGYRQPYIAVLQGKKVLYEHRGDNSECIEYSLDGLQIKSAGLGGGNLASIVIDGEEYAIDTRGINMVVFDTAENKVVHSAAYDTCGRPMWIE